MLLQFEILVGLGCNVTVIGLEGRDGNSEHGPPKSNLSWAVVQRYLRRKRFTRMLYMYCCRAARQDGSHDVAMQQ